MKQFILFSLLLAFCCCKKYLDKKPDKSLVIPETLADLQAILDNNGFMNNFTTGNGEGSADDYYLTDAVWASMAEADRNLYIWGDEITFNTVVNPWFTMYRTIYYSNVVLESIEKNQANSNQVAWQNLAGSSLFFRARALHNIVLTWANAYDLSTASADMGIPLRLTSDFNAPSTRSSLSETYKQLITDLETAIPLLPVTPAHVMRPSKPAAYALLSRVYLSMRNYTLAGIYADSSLQLNNTLLDFNTLNAANPYPIPRFNTEVLFHATGLVSPVSNTRAKIDSLLYRSYTPNDLRKPIYFKAYPDSGFFFRGSYDNSPSFFFGSATDEMYLTKAECLAREGKSQEAMSTLNALLIKRWKTGTFIPLSVTNASEALAIILGERRKELVMRDIRWMDIKRLNKEGANITLKRFLNGQVYQLGPNDPKFALPIPAYIINLTGIPQNPR